MTNPMLRRHRTRKVVTAVREARRAIDRTASRAQSPHARRERRRALRAARLAAWRAKKVGITGVAGDRQLRFWLRRSGRSLEASFRKPPRLRRARALAALVVIGAAGAGAQRVRTSANPPR
jgi:hypothetical protein